MAKLYEDLFIMIPHKAEYIKIYVLIFHNVPQQLILKYLIL